MHDTPENIEVINPVEGVPADPFDQLNPVEIVPADQFDQINGDHIEEMADQFIPIHPVNVVQPIHNQRNPDPIQENPINAELNNEIADPNVVPPLAVPISQQRSKLYLCYVIIISFLGNFNFITLHVGNIFFLILGNIERLQMLSPVFCSDFTIYSENFFLIKNEL